MTISFGSYTGLCSEIEWIRLRVADPPRVLDLNRVLAGHLDAERVLGAIRDAVFEGDQEFVREQVGNRVIRVVNVLVVGDGA